MSLKDIYEIMSLALTRFWDFIININIIPILIVLGLYFIGVFIYAFITAWKEDRENRRDRKSTKL